ncbi:MAG: redoxin domain-containing protein [Bacteroidetes bacterium]|nr:MAG: redoxin domain-containing protein [Bacteroidota bacterium]
MNQMKKTILLLLVVAVAASCAKDPKFRITGTIDGAGNETVILQKRIPGGYEVMDSVALENGAFTMEGVVPYPQMVNLAIKGKRGGLNFYIENSDITIHAHADSIYTGSVSGSAAQAEFDSYKAMFDETNAEMMKVYDRYRAARMEGNEELASSIEKELEEIDNRQNTMRKEFIANNPSSYVAPAVISELAYYLEASELEDLLGKLDTTLNQVQTVVTLKERLVHLKAVATGQKAPDFTLNDVDGNPVSLYSKLGGDTKLLLVDFWAAWCGPCRQENPNVVKVWNDYNKKGFDVFGVSLDRTKEDWVKAIEDDKLTWTHVSDLKYWDCEPAKLYAVSAIPSNFLLDGDGIIVGHNLRGDALAEKVKEILDTK